MWYHMCFMGAFRILITLLVRLTAQLYTIFCLGGSAGYSTYQLPKVYETAEKVMSRRGVVFDDIEKDILEKVFELTFKQRNY